MDLSKAARDPWVWGQVGLLGLVLLGVPRLAAAGLLGARVGAPWPALAAGIAALGGLVTLWGFRSLGPNLTPGTEPLAAGQMVERGAYAWVRHPIYVGLSLFLAGWAGWTGTPAALLLTAAVSFGYFDRKAAAEERWMTSRFPAYAAYQQRVGKLWPRLGARPARS